MSVEFKDFSMQVKAALEEKAIQFLHEASGEMVAQVARNIDTAKANDTGQLKNSFTFKIDEGKLKATIGSPLENAIWTEFGTGEYALKGNGRKGGWYVPSEKLSSKAKSKMQKRIVKGKEYYFTRGKKPVRMFHNAYNTMKPKIIKMGQQKFKELGK